MKEVRLFLANLKQKGVRLYLEDGKLKSQAPAGAINGDERQYIKTNKQSIIEYLETLIAAGQAGKRTVIAKQNKQIAELSFAQQRLWFIDSMLGGSAEYNMPIAFNVKGQLDRTLLTEVFTTILQRHEVLRTVYVQNNGQTLQQVRSIEDVNFMIVEKDLSHLTGETLEAQVRHLVEADVTTPFNLTSDLMLRVSYLNKRNHEGVMIFNMHHIASDGWSLEVLTKEFFALYQALSQGKANPLPELAIQYSDYAIWQREYLETQVLEGQLDYWQKQLDELPVTHSLPLDNPRPSVKQSRGAIVTGNLPGTVAKPLLDLAKTHKLTPFMLLHGAVSLLLSRHSNCDDIVIGTPVANRLQAELEPLIGFFVNTQVLRVDTAQQNLSDYFAHVRQVHLDAQANQDVPFEQLVERLKAPRNTAHTPLFQIMLATNTDYGVNDSASLETFSLSAAECSLYPSELIQSKFDLDIELNISEQGVGLKWNYDVSLFTEQHINQLNTHLCRLLGELANNTELAAPNALPMLSEDEVQHLVAGLNDKRADYPKDKCIHELFEQQVQNHPDNIALMHGEQQLTYRQLNEKANQLAHYLKEKHGVKPDTLVGLCVERSLEMVIGMLGILKAGGAYVPLDPSYPQERLSYLIGDAAMDLVLCHTDVQSALISFNGTILALDGLAGTDTNHLFGDYAKSNLAVADTGCSAANLAYVIYTSGSTGKPKGVLIEHHCVNNLVYSQKTTYQIKDNDNEAGLMLASFAFDAAVEQIFIMLLSGNTLVVPSKEQVLYPQALLDVVFSKRITHIDSTPSHLMSLVECFKCQSIKRVVSGGEAMLPQLCEAVGGNVALFNVYGPTEACVTSSVAKSGLSIGKPIANTEFYLLNDALSLVPMGVVGELFIGGDGLARGYLNRAEMTEQRFIANPFYDATIDNAKRLYRTGDLVRYLPDGNLEFLGRIDDQVKIRGYRIELGEVEVQLGQVSYVHSALVMTQSQAGGEQLVGYVKPVEKVDDEQLTDFISKVKNELAKSVPNYMVPGIIMVVEHWPLTPNGKIDRKALPSPDTYNMFIDYVAPQTTAEKTLVGVWGNLLNIEADTISVEANFFDLGGHSLLSIRLVSEIRLTLAVEISIQDIFEHPTLQALALVVEQSAMAPARPPLQAVKRDTQTVDVSFAQQRLWFIDSLQGGSPQYNMPMAFEVDGQLDLALLSKVFNTIIARHEVLRTVYLQRGGETLQHIRSHTDIEFSIKVEDLSDIEAALVDGAVKGIIEAEITKPFDLANDLMLRVCYIKKSLDRGVMVFNMHHIASDGWSMDVLTNEFFSLFNAYSKGMHNPLPELAVQYADYSHWQKEYLGSGVLESQLDYWQKQLDDLPTLHSLSLDYPRPAVKQHQGAIVAGYLSADVALKLQALAKAHKLTPFMVLHGALSLLLSRHSNSNDIVIGTPVANRLQTALEPLIGFFVNTLVLRANTEHTNLADYFAHIRQVNLDAQANQDVPFEQLVDSLKAPRSQAYSPLFQIMLTTNTDYGVEGDTELQSFNLGDVQCHAMRSGIIQAKFDLEIELSMNDKGVELRWNYDTALFSEQHVQQLNQHLCRLLTELGNNPQSNTTVNTLPILSDEEQAHLAFELNNTEMAYDKNACIHQLFEQQVDNAPDQVAVVFENEQLSYQQLNQKANQLAHYLKENHQVKPDTLVGLCTERSLEMVIGIMAILKAGGAYVPLDPSYPQDRINYMLEDGDLNVVLSQSRFESKLGELKGDIVTIDGFATDSEHRASAYPDCNLTLEQTALTSSNLAYVIYTSGSTGKPKGVMVEHQALFNRVHWMHNTYRLNSSDKVLQKTPFSFDVSVWEFVWTLAYGGQMVVARPQGHKDPEYLCQLIQQQGVTKLHFVPSMLGVILESEQFKHCDSIKQVFCSGEALQPGHVEGFTEALPNAQLHNLYGPTEAAIDVSYWDCAADITQGVPIGKPIDNIQLMILDSHLNMVPKGAVGELHIGGDGLARGYLNRETLTAERFIDNPYYQSVHANSSPRLYKTGDLARIRPDGEIEYQGRTDHQVKIRGLRIELGEVETQLSQLKVVDSALVMSKALSGSEQLVAYVKPVDKVQEQGIAQYIGLVKNELGQTLPEYMVPSIIMVLDQWPLTPNGKVDRKALPAPAGSALYGEFVAPGTEVELKLAGILAGLLDLPQDKISASASFFDLGASSIMLIKVLHQVQEVFETNVTVENIYQHQTILALSQFIEEENAIQKVTQTEQQEEAQWEI